MLDLVKEKTTDTESDSQEEKEATIEEKSSNQEDQRLQRSQRQNKGIPPNRYCNTLFRRRRNV